MHEICQIKTHDSELQGQEVVFRVWVHKQAPLDSQWQVLRIGGADFLHCWVANSIWLEHAEPLTTK